MRVSDILKISAAIRAGLRAFEIELEDLSREEREKAMRISADTDSVSTTAAQVKVPDEDREVKFDPSILNASRSEMISFIEKAGLDFDPSGKKRETIQRFLREKFKSKLPKVPELKEGPQEDLQVDEDELRAKATELKIFLNENKEEEEVKDHFSLMNCNQDCEDCSLGKNQVLKCYATFDHEV